MRIALLTDSFSVGGGLEYMYQVARNLPEHEFIVCAKGGPECSRFNNLPNVLIDTTGYGPITVISHKPDVIHFNHLRPLAAHLMQLGRPFCPTINGIHGIHLRRYEYLHGPVNAIKAALRRRLERRCISKVDLNIAETEADKSFLEAQLGAKRVEVIPNGIDIALPFGFPRTTNQHGISLLMVARFDFQKGHDVLLRATASIQRQLRLAECTIQLVGDGPLRRAMEQLAVALGISDLVRFCGASRELDSLFASSDCVVMPSRWEGMPFVLLEAGRFGKDVICSDAAGLAEVTGNGRCATLFRNGDAEGLATALANYLNGVGRNMGPALRQHVCAHYSRERMITLLKAAYRRVSAA